MTKPTYCLWKSDFINEIALSLEKNKYTAMGFRVVIYQDGEETNDIHIGLRKIIQNHYLDNTN